MMLFFYHYHNKLNYAVLSNEIFWIFKVHKAFTETDRTEEPKIRNVVSNGNTF